VPDDLDARLVVLGIDHPYSREPGNPAETAAKAILESRGSAPRLYRNTLAFLAADHTRLQDLDEAARRFLAWKSILDEKVELNLDPQQVKQAETQQESADGAVTARLPETYMWLVVPVQSSPEATVEWQASRLTGQEALAVRAGRKLRNDELLVTGFAATRLRMELDRVPLWRGNHVAVKQLVEDFARYPYLPRLKEPAVLLQAIRDGLGLLTWGQDSFAYADNFDEATGRYRGLRCGQIVNVTEDDLSGLLVRPEVALAQQQAEAPLVIVPPAEPLPPGGAGEPRPGEGPGKNEPRRARRFHGSVVLIRSASGATPGALPTRSSRTSPVWSVPRSRLPSKSRRKSRRALRRMSSAPSPRIAER
jgi:hypothetical protein